MSHNMGKLRSVKKVRTRESLITAAIRVFSRDGFLAARTSEIAEEAGLAHGTVFLHFPTQETLTATVIEECGLRIAARIHELAERGAGVREVLDAHLRGIGEFEAFYARLAIEGPLLPARARNSILGIHSALSFHMGEASERDQKAGIIRPIPMYFLFNTWIGLVHYYLANRELFSPGGSVIGRRGAELIENFMNMIGSGGSKEEAE